MLTDLKFAIRQLRKTPTFTITAILTLAMGIGANTAIFTLIDSIILQPLPYAHQEQLMRIGYGSGVTDAAFFPKGWIRALGEHSNSFSSVSGFGPNAESNIGEAGSPNRVFGAEVMTNALETLNLLPTLGRFFSWEDGRSGSDPVVVLSHNYWQERFAADPSIIGKRIRIDGISRRIIGILPEEVRFPYADTDFLTPVTFKGGDPIDPWQTFDLRAFGRLRSGATARMAQVELPRLQSALLPMFPWRMPDTWARDMRVIPLLDAEIGEVRPRLMLLFAAVGLILLIACANVANLMLARAAGRQNEIAVRGALGASSSRLMRQFLVESMLLGIAAGTVALLAAAASVRLVSSLMPADTPRIASRPFTGPSTRLPQALRCWPELSLD